MKKNELNYSRLQTKKEETIFSHMKRSSDFLKANLIEQVKFHSFFVEFLTFA